MNQPNSNFGSFAMLAKKLKTCRDIAILSASISLCTLNAYAEQKPNLIEPKVVVPEKISGVATINAEQVIEALTSDSPPLLIDARIKEDRSYGHIENSLSLPDIETNCNTLKAIIPDKNQALIFYCNGIQCGRSVVSIKVARSCDYHSLSWFKGGFTEWKDKGYPYIRSH